MIPTQLQKEAQGYRSLSLPEKGNLSRLSSETRWGAMKRLLVVEIHALVACLMTCGYGQNTIAAK